MADPGIVVTVVGLIAAVIGLVLIGVSYWLRQGVVEQAQFRDDQIDRRLRGRSDMEAERTDCEIKVKDQLAAVGLPDLAAAEDLLVREEAHVAQIDRLTAQMEGLVGKEPPETLLTAARRGRPRDLAEGERARCARTDRQGTARPGAPGGRGARPGGGPGARPRR